MNMNIVNHNLELLTSDTDERALSEFLLPSPQARSTEHSHVTPVGVYYNWFNGEILEFTTVCDPLYDKNYAFGILDIEGGDGTHRVKFTQSDDPEKQMESEALVNIGKTLEHYHKAVAGD